MLVKKRCVRSFQNKHVLEIFPFLSNNCRKTGNVRTGTEIVNPCIKLFYLHRSYKKVVAELSEENLKVIRNTLPSKSGNPESLKK